MDFNIFSYFHTESWQRHAKKFELIFVIKCVSEKGCYKFEMF